MVAASKKIKNVGLPPQVNTKLVRVCKARGWKKNVAVDRMLDREIELLEREQPQPSPTP